MKQQQFRSPYFRLTISCTLLLLASLPAWTLEPAPSAAKSSYFHHASVGYLGVDFEDLTNSQRVDFHLQGKQGVAIAAVDHDAPAGQAGLKAQDVVLRMNGYLAQNAAQLRAMLHKLPVGSTVTLNLLRGGHTLERSVQLADRGAVEKRAWSQHYTVPDPAQVPAQTPVRATAQPPTAVTTQAPIETQAPTPTRQPDAHAQTGFLGQASSEIGKTFGSNGLLMSWIPGTNALYTGIEVNPIGPQLAKYFGVPGGVGLLVGSVDLNSPGSRAGIQAGDIVLKVDDVLMTSRSRWQHVLHENRNSLLLLQIQRDRQPMTLTMSVHATR
ncbi:MAG TPA: PDZ domain-containing protein [Acidobacteriaceae bacterium]|nr:PDZ domain-containing protein [Acidobacteriaceae bacterium]